MGTVRKPHPCGPIVFIDDVTEESVRTLIDKICLRAVDLKPDSKETVDVVFSTRGGNHSAAIGFFGWMKRFPQRENFRAVAAGEVSSSGITLFLAFDRRATDPTSQFIFHKLKYVGKSDDNEAFIVKKTEEQLVRFIIERTKLTKELVFQLMEKQLPLGMENSLSSGICTEDV